MDGFGKFRRGGHDDHLEYHSEDGPIIGKDLCSIRLCKFTARDFALRVSVTLNLRQRDNPGTVSLQMGLGHSNTGRGDGTSKAYTAR